MNEIYLPDYKMMNVVKVFLKTNEPIWTTNSVVNNCFNRLSTNIDLINHAKQMLMHSSQDITMPKQIMRNKLNISMFTIKESMRLYHQINGTNEEMLMLEYPISKLKKKTEDTFYVEACHISQRSLGLGALLFPLGITQLMLDTFETDLVEFNAFNPEREIFLEQKKAFVKIIPLKIKETKTMFRTELDSLIATFGNNNQNFAHAYKIVRKSLKKTGPHKYYSVLIYGKLSNKTTSIAISDVVLVAGKKKKTAITDAKGNYKIRIYTKDADTITFSHKDFETLIIDIPKKQIKHQINLIVSLAPIIKPKPKDNLNIS
jgi:hypothetical protein